MGKYKAKVNLTLGVPGEKHMHVKKGDVFECDESYADEHFEDHHIEDAEEGEEVTTEVKAKVKKAAKAEKKAAKAKKD